MQKMKNIGKYAGVVCAIAALFLSISFVFAENAASTSKISDLNDRKQKFMQEANQRAASTHSFISVNFFRVCRKCHKHKQNLRLE